MTTYKPIRDKDAFPYAKNYGHHETKNFKYDGGFERIANLETNLDALYDTIQEQQKRIALLMDMVGLLARAESIRIDRAKARNNG